MNIRIQSIHFDADKKLLEYIEDKVAKLETYYDRLMECHVHLKLEKLGSMHSKIVEIKVTMPGKTLFAKEDSSTFEESTDKSVEALRRQLTKHKEKIRGQ